MEYEDVIKSCIAQKKQMTIEREEIDEEPITAIPIMISQQLLLIHYLYDFYLDGYKVLCLADITEIERGEIEKFHDKIIEKEKILDSLSVPNVSIGSWESFFNTIIKENRLIDISLENVLNRVSFFVGKVKVVGKNHLELLEIDGLGFYKKETTTIFYSDITLVSFGNRYSEFLNKYS